MEEKINKNIKMALPCLICNKLVEVKSEYTQVVICEECRSAILNVKENFKKIYIDVEKLKLAKALRNE